MLVTVRRPGVRMAPIRSISACRQLRWKKSGAKQRMIAAKRGGSRSMVAALWREHPSLTAHPLRCLRPGNGQTRAKDPRVIEAYIGVGNGLAVPPQSPLRRRLRLRRFARRTTLTPGTASPYPAWINFDVFPGEVVTLLGRNGADKKDHDHEVDHGHS